MDLLLHRPRRLRRTARLRRWVAETTVTPGDLMMPYFLVAGRGVRQPIVAMPGVDRLSLDLLLEAVAAGLAVGIDQVMLFGVVAGADKDAVGSAASRPDSLVAGAVGALRERFGEELLIATDVCLCAYTSHGHCGVVVNDAVDDRATWPALGQMAVAHAAAGADVVAPSDMMDGRVGAIRAALDEAGWGGCVLMSYAAKYASAYYAPFREAAQSAPGRGDRRGYQMDVRNRREARREVALDVAEGADVVMVKPALPYLDVIADVRARCDLPLACYSVGGEYTMVKAAAARGFVDEAQVVRENLLAMRRAGADIILTYHANEAAAGGWLRS